MGDGQSKNEKEISNNVQNIEIEKGRRRSGTDDDDDEFQNIKNCCYRIAFDIDMDKEPEKSKYWHSLAASEKHEKDELYKELEKWDKDWKNVFRKKYNIKITDR